VKKLETLRDILKPFAESTDIVQGNSANLWHFFIALERVLQHFVQDSEEHDVVRHALNKRAPFLVSPAAFLLAFLSPNLPRGVISEAVRLLGISWHAKLLGEHAHFAPQLDDNRRPPLPRAVRPTDWISADVTAPGFRPIRQAADFHTSLVLRLMDVVPTEAAVERVFSELKRNLTAFRTTCAPAAATCQVFYNCCNAFLQNEAGESLTTAVSASTFRWVVEHAEHLALQQAQKSEEALELCGVCKDPHDGSDPKKWWACQKCTQWYYVPCLGLRPQKIAEIEALDVWECNLDEWCLSLPSGVRAIASGAQLKKK
jgi:hypothetical protein